MTDHLSPCDADKATRVKPDDAAATAPHRLVPPLAFDGLVLHGAKIGRTIGFPTANIALQGLRPPLGIYAARGRLEDGRERPGVAYFGSRPTVDGEGELLEVFLFDFAGDIYGQRLWVELIAFIRPDQRFASLDLMMGQMEHDRADALRFLES